MRLAGGCLLAGALALGGGQLARAGEGPPGEEPPGQIAAEAASHEEVEPLAVEFGELTSLVLAADGRLLACDAKTAEIKVIGPDGKQAGAIRPGIAPEAIDVAPDGAIYCGGQGQVVRLDAQGKVLGKVDVPKDLGAPERDAAGGPQRGGPRPQRVSGIAASDRDVFVAYGAGWSLRSQSVLIRFDRDLDHPKLLAKDLRGCCQRCDIVTRGGRVYVAENTRHQVVCFDREGETVDSWGERTRGEVDGFGSCCNPMNLCFDAAGALYTAESGLGRVKRYTAGGKLLGLVGYVDVERFNTAGHLAASCSNIAIAATPDGSRVYVMDYKNNLVRVLQKQ